METFYYELTAYIGIIIIVYLISDQFSWFSRREVTRDIKPKLYQCEDNAKSLFRFANRETSGSYRIVIPHVNDEVRVKDIKRRELFHFQVDEKFLKENNSKNLGKAAKLAGFIEWRANSNIIIKLFRILVSFAINLIYLFSVVPVVMIFISVFNWNISIMDVLPTIFLIATLLVVGNVVLTFKECLVYIWQNLYSMKILKDFGVEVETEQSVKRYLWNSMICYIGVSILKFIIMLVVIIVFSEYIPV